MNIERTIEMAEERCFDCGRWWACERYRTGTCPICAKDRISRCLADQTKLERSNAALRGALKRRKK